MGDIIVDGKTKVAFAPAIADPSEPTVTEIEAGIPDLDIPMTADGLIGYEPETAEVDTTGLRSVFDSKRPGRGSFSGTSLRIKKQSEDPDEPYETLTRNTEGYVVIRRYVDAAAPWASGDKVGVYPIQCGELRELPPEPNTTARYEVPTMITADPELRATVASGGGT